MRIFETIRQTVAPNNTPPTVPTDIPIIPGFVNSLEAGVAAGFLLLLMLVDDVMTVGMLGIAVIIGMLVAVVSVGMAVVGAAMVVGVRVVFAGVNAVKLRVMTYLN